MPLTPEEIAHLETETLIEAIIFNLDTIQPQCSTAGLDTTLIVNSGLGRINNLTLKILGLL